MKGGGIKIPCKSRETINEMACTYVMVVILLLIQVALCWQSSLLPTTDRSALDNSCGVVGRSVCFRYKGTRFECSQ